MLTIETNLLNAALQCVAVKDIRYYLNGVHIYKPENNDFIYVTGTDGHQFFIGRQLASAAPPFEIIIPSETIKTAVKDAGKHRYIDLVMGEKNILGNQIFTPIEGKYPDISRIIPDQISVVDATNAPTVDNIVAQFNPAYLLSCTKALNIASGKKKDVPVMMHHRGHNSLIILENMNPDTFCGIMPLRTRNIKDEDYVHALFSPHKIVHTELQVAA
jgi:DNA polymerase III beta subunit, central domain